MTRAAFRPVVGEDVRARAAIERFTDRLVASAKPGTRRETLRPIAVTVAKRVERRFGYVDFSVGRKLTKTQALVYVRESLSRHLLDLPRVRVAAERIAKTMMDLNPATMTDRTVALGLAEHMVVSRLMETDEMAALALAILETVLAQQVAPADGRAAVEAAVDPGLVAAAGAKAVLARDVPTDHYLAETITIYPAKDAATPVLRGLALTP